MSYLGIIFHSKYNYLKHKFIYQNCIDIKSD